jgi:hypothetical protein
MTDPSSRVNKRQPGLFVRVDRAKHGQLQSWAKGLAKQKLAKHVKPVKVRESWLSR